MDIVLALGGGGIKGVAHIPVLQALDDLGIRPKAVAGTSVGALVGSAYAAGMTGDALAAYVRDLAANKAKALWAMASDGRNLRLGGLLSGEALYDFCVPDDVPHDFEGLEIPFTAVTTDYFSQERIALRSGSLRTAVAASIAIPGVFAPVIVDGRTLVDGGLVSNLPLGELPAGFSIGVDVLDYPVPGGPAHGRIKAAIGALQIMIKHATTKEIEARPPDLLVTPDTGGVGPMDFGQLVDLMEANSWIRDQVKRVLTEAMERSGA